MSFSISPPTGKKNREVIASCEANQLLKVTEPDGRVTTFSYDENGNMIAKVKETEDETRTATYNYDFNNRLIKVEIVEDNETRTVEYAYDGLGNRIKRTETNEEGERKVVDYVNDVSQPLTQVLQETNQGGKTQTSYVYGLDLISRIDKKNKPDYYLYDGLGSVVGLANQQGSLTTKYSYDEWGVPTPQSKFGQGGQRGNTYGFTGEDYDQDTGLLYLRARYYQPEVGRFVSRDRAQSDTLYPQTLNRYVYCRDNPTNLIDPAGELSFAAFVPGLIGAAAGFTLPLGFQAVEDVIVGEYSGLEKYRDVLIQESLPGAGIGAVTKYIGSWGVLIDIATVWVYIDKTYANVRRRTTIPRALAPPTFEIPKIPVQKLPSEEILTFY